LRISPINRKRAFNTDLRKCRSAWRLKIRRLDAEARSRGLLLRRSLYGVYRGVPSEARDLLRLWLPALSLPRHRSRSQPSAAI